MDKAFTIAVNIFHNNYMSNFHKLFFKVVSALDMLYTDCRISIGNFYTLKNLLVLHNSSTSCAVTTGGEARGDQPPNNFLDLLFYIQTRRVTEFFRVGELSTNTGTSINI